MQFDHRVTARQSELTETGRSEYTVRNYSAFASPYVVAGYMDSAVQLQKAQRSLAVQRDAVRNSTFSQSTVQNGDFFLCCGVDSPVADRAVDGRCVKPRVLRKLRPLRIGKRGKLRAHGVFGLQRRSAHSQLSGRP